MCVCVRRERDGGMCMRLIIHKVDTAITLQSSICIAYHFSLSKLRLHMPISIYISLPERLCDI